MWRPGGSFGGTFWYIWGFIWGSFGFIWVHLGSFGPSGWSENHRFLQNSELEVVHLPACAPPLYITNSGKPPSPPHPWGWGRMGGEHDNKGSRLLDFYQAPPPLEFYRRPRFLELYCAPPLLELYQRPRRPRRGRRRRRQAGKSAGRRVGRSASRQVGKSAGRQVGKSAGRQVGKSASRQVGRSAGWGIPDRFKIRRRLAGRQVGFGVRAPP